LELLPAIALSSLAVLLAVLDRLLGARPLAKASALVFSLTAAAAALHPSGEAWLPLAATAVILALLYRGEEPWR